MSVYPNLFDNMVSNIESACRAKKSDWLGTMRQRVDRLA